MHTIGNWPGILLAIQILVTSCKFFKFNVDGTVTCFKRVCKPKAKLVVSQCNRFFRQVAIWTDLKIFELVFAQHFDGCQPPPKSAELLNYERRDTKHVTRRMNSDLGKAPAVKRDVITPLPQRHLAATFEKKTVKRYGHSGVAQKREKTNRITRSRRFDFQDQNQL